MSGPSHQVWKLVALLNQRYLPQCMDQSDSRGHVSGGLLPLNASYTVWNQTVGQTGPEICSYHVQI